MAGISPRARILPCKALDANGWGLISKVIECISLCRWVACCPVVHQCEWTAMGCGCKPVAGGSSRKSLSASRCAGGLPAARVVHLWVGTYGLWVQARGWGLISKVIECISLCRWVDVAASGRQLTPWTAAHPHARLAIGRPAAPLSCVHVNLSDGFVHMGLTCRRSRGARVIDTSFVAGRFAAARSAALTCVGLFF